MTKKKQQELNQDEHVTAVLDKRTNKTAAISKMNEQDGSIEVVPPNKKNNNSFLKQDRTTPLELFFTNFKTSTKILQASVSSLYHLLFWTRH